MNAPVLRIRDEAGNITLDSDATLLRHFGYQEIPFNWSGTFPMPGFNSDDGFFIPAFRCNKYNVSPATTLPDSAAWTKFECYSVVVPQAFPDLSWDTATGIMTVTKNTLPSGFENASYNTRTNLRFYYYQGGTTAPGGDISFKIPSGQVSFDKTIYLKEQGQTSRFFQGQYRHLASDNFGTLANLLNNTSPNRDDMLQAATTGYNVFPAGGVGHDVSYPNFYDLDDLAFYRLTSPITFSTSIYHEYPEIPQGLCPLVATWGNASVDYKIGSLDLPDYTPTGAALLRLRNPAGEVVYDSRYPTIEVVHTALITETQMRGVILDNDVIDITLPVSVPDPWVCCPYWISFRANDAGSSVRIIRPQISKLNDTTLRIERNKGVGGDPLLKQAFQAAWVIVAR